MIHMVPKVGTYGTANKLLLGNIMQRYKHLIFLREISNV